MHEIVAALDENLNDVKELVGKKVKSFQDALTLLKPTQTAVLQIGTGSNKGWYKNVWVDKDGAGWIQRRCSPEY